LDVIAGNSDVASSLLQLVDSALGCTEDSLDAPAGLQAGSSCDLVDALYDWLSRNQEQILAGTPIQRTVYTHAAAAAAPLPQRRGSSGGLPDVATSSFTSLGSRGGGLTPAPTGKPTATRVMAVADMQGGMRRSISAQSIHDLPLPPRAGVTPPPPLSTASTPTQVDAGPPKVLQSAILSFSEHDMDGSLPFSAPLGGGGTAAIGSPPGSAARTGAQSMQRGEPVTILYYHESMHAMATAVARLSQGRVLLRGVNWDSFGDGWPDTFIQQVKDARYNDVAFLACLDSPATWFAQVSVMICLPKYAARSLHIIIPYFQGTMERVDTPGQVATTAVQAHILSSIPPAVVGPAQITLLDLHNLTTTHYFGPGVHVRPKSLVPLLLTELFALPDTANISIAFPDEGSFKRFSPKFVHLFPTVVCKKRRLPNGERRVEIHDGADHVKGRHVVIVDDLVQSGGTLLRCAEALNALGPTAVSAYVSHGVFPSDSWKKFLHAPPTSSGTDVAASPGAPSAGGGAMRFKHFWLTDSIPSTAAAVQGKAPFVVLQCAGMVWDAVLQYKQCLHGAVV